jgi:hypothetical protein
VQRANALKPRLPDLCLVVRTRPTRCNETT